jgi:hypothetical protein
MIRDKRVHFVIEVWGYGDDAREAWQDAAENLDLSELPTIAREVDVKRCDECGGEFAPSRPIQTRCSRT